MIPGEPIEELLGAYALDAVDPDEKRSVEEYLASNPRARAEVEQHREVATMLAYSGTTAPDGLWDRIASALDEPAPMPGPELARIFPPPDRVGIATGTPSGRRRVWTRATAGVLAAAAVVAIAVLSATVVERARELDRLRQAAAAPTLSQLYGSALRLNTTKVVALRSVDGNLAATAAFEPDGTGYLSANRLPQLDEAKTYQLWGAVDAGQGPKVISLGVLGRHPDIVPFVVGQGKLVALVITEEGKGGVPVSTQQAALKGDVI